MSKLSARRTQASTVSIVGRSSEGPRMTELTGRFGGSVCQRVSFEVVKLTKRVDPVGL
jgi:hypothetical protein